MSDDQKDMEYEVPANENASLDSEAVEEKFVELDLSHLPSVKGHTFEDEFSFEDFIKSYSTIGLQGSCLYQAIEIIRTVRTKKIPIFMGITSNIGTCGLRESMTYLIKNNFISAVAATAGAIEEDVMKTMGDFKLGEYKNDDVALYKAKVNRTGNILVPSRIYAQLHMFLNTLNQDLWKKAWMNGKPITDAEYIYELGKLMEELDVNRKEESFVYQAYKNNITVYCPALMDGAIGDALYQFCLNKNSMGITEHAAIMDNSQSTFDLITKMEKSKKVAGDVCLLAIGGSVSKHMICNSAIFSGGAKYCVYINTSTEAEGSNAGAPVSEAITWGKVHPEATSAKVQAEATLVMPLLIAAAFQTWQPKPL